jgi:hypothetical protein
MSDSTMKILAYGWILGAMGFILFGKGPLALPLLCLAFLAVAGLGRGQ